MTRTSEYQFYIFMANLHQTDIDTSRLLVSITNQHSKQQVNGMETLVLFIKPDCNDPST